MSCQRLGPLPSKSLDNRSYCFYDGSLHKDSEDREDLCGWMCVRACTYVGHRSEEGSLVVSEAGVRGRNERRKRVGKGRRTERKETAVRERNTMITHYQHGWEW